MPLEDDAEDDLDRVLGQTHHLLGEAGDELAQRLVLQAKLSVRRDGGYFNPIPGDNWTAASYEAVLQVPPFSENEYTQEIIGRIWTKLETVLTRHGREDVFSLVVQPAPEPLPSVDPDWRSKAHLETIAPPTNQARRERTAGGYPTRDGLTFTSRAEVVVYELLVGIQRDCPPEKALAILPLAGAKLRDAGVRSPDFVVIGNGRALVIEVDGPHHYRTTRKADDADRDRHWDRCGVRTIRIGTHHVEHPDALDGLLREELRRWLFGLR
ncbi:hypothetical protein [Actinomadura opuntiae]|uniref:hypothetical protein n=1 Tax=Actinomadura sp. OS1-43 TaxID=604315 RepID=UPI00255AB1FD|nr:hypothetical protein [Actinomadura sp. OS1-43]MDL4815981.1 hypothetical protein [Actinomadura sp. OS1-43]